MTMLAVPNLLPTSPIADGTIERYGRLKSLEKAPTPRQMREIGEAWSPYRPVAAWYLWRLPGR